MIHVYVIRSLVNRRRYVGITAQLGERLRTHARKSSKGGQLLDRFELIHREVYNTYSEARSREMFLKSGQGRRWLDERFGPTGVDTTPASPTVCRSVRGVA